MTFGRKILFASAAAMSLVVVPAQGATVEKGWDIWETSPGTVYPAPGTYFTGLPFEGVPLNVWDFGPGIGLKSLGANADTIVQRLDAAFVPGSTGVSDPIDLEMVAWQLKSVNAFDAGMGLDYHFLTLQSLRGGPASTGQMTIQFDRDPLPEAGAYGTFTSYIDVAWDLRIGCLTCAIVTSDIWRLESQPTPWGRIPLSNALTIPGVNEYLNGIDRSHDFWPSSFLGMPGDGWFVEEHPAGSASLHRTRPAIIPEPGTWMLLIAGFGLVGGAMRRRKIEAVAA